MKIPIFKKKKFFLKIGIFFQNREKSQLNSIVNGARFRPENTQKMGKWIIWSFWIVKRICLGLSITQYIYSYNVFQVLLDELHEQGRLNSMSLWMDLFLIITQDLRFGHMLGQAGRCKS